MIAPTQERSATVRLRPASPDRGFTLIELMVALAVLAILIIASIPSFLEFRQRAALRGAADQAIGLWADARFEALRRNSMVKFNFVETDGAMCIGVATTTDPADATPCDCLTPGACNIAAYPSDQSEWRGVRLASAATLGQNTGVVVIDHKRANLTQAADAGNILLRSPEGGSADYRLNIAVDRNGRAYLCEPSDAASKLPQYSDRRC